MSILLHAWTLVLKRIMIACIDMLYMLCMTVDYDDYAMIYFT